MNKRTVEALISLASLILKSVIFMFRCVCSDQSHSLGLVSGTPGKEM